MNISGKDVQALSDAGGTLINACKATYDALEAFLTLVRDFERRRRADEEADDELCDCASDSALDLVEYSVALRHTIQVYGHDIARLMQNIIEHMGSEEKHPQARQQLKVIAGILLQQDPNMTVREVLTRAGLVPEEGADKALN